MRTTTRTCLAVCTCCVLALRALALPRDREEIESKEKQAIDDFDFDFEGINDNEPELASYEVERALAPFGRLEPEAEMLPANYAGVKPPGVDHMEIRLSQGRKLEEPAQVPAQEPSSSTRRSRRKYYT